MQELYGNVPASELTDLMRVEPKPFLSLLLNPFGTHARGIEHRDLQLIIDARRGRKVHLKNLTAPPTVTKGLLGTTVRIEMDDGSGVALRGVNHRPANVFAQEVQEAWSAFNIELFEC
ncbi:hypothetical protein [Pseudophaeobacter sp.]|uniref:hypothetical protein n=1 Tax=Pseudophaeobacter sp. TaxID=1971739 RepID=UPI0032D8B686